MRSHRLRVPEDVLDAVGGREGAIEALRRGPVAETVAVDVDDATWTSYEDARGSIQVREMYNRLAVEASANGTKPDRPPRQPGTLFVTRKATECPVCHRELYPHMVAVEATRADGKTAALHVDCAKSDGIQLTASDRTLNGGVRSLLRAQRKAILDSVHSRLAGLLGYVGNLYEQ